MHRQRRKLRKALHLVRHAAAPIYRTLARMRHLPRMHAHRALPNARVVIGAPCRVRLTQAVRAAPFLLQRLPQVARRFLREVFVHDG